MTSRYPEVPVTRKGMWAWYHFRVNPKACETTKAETVGRVKWPGEDAADILL